MPYTNDFTNFDSSTWDQGAITPTSDKNILKERDKRALSVLPSQLLSSYNNIAQNGIYGQSGMDAMTGASRAAAAFRFRNLLKAAMQGGAASRLGSRSGAYQTFLANKVYAPYLGEDASRQAGILQENLMSRMQGLQGASGIMDFLQNRTNQEWWKKGSQKGVMDYVSAIAGNVLPFLKSGTAAGATGATSGNSSGLSPEQLQALQQMMMGL